MSHKNEKNHQRKNDEINFETDSLRFMCDAYLTEFQKSREEILTFQDSIKEVANYVMITLGIFVTGIQFFDITTYETSTPVFFLIFAFLFLYFPVRFINLHMTLLNLGRYSHDVLAPKLDHLIMIDSGNQSIKEQVMWEKETFPFPLVGALKWDEFLEERIKERQLFWFTLVFVRFTFVFVPSLILLYLYFSSLPNPISTLSLSQMILSIFFLILYIYLFLTLVIGALKLVFEYK